MSYVLCPGYYCGMPPPPISRVVPADIQAALAEEYEILSLLGQGGMASVYLARERSLGRLVALKVLAPDLAARPGFRARFEREAATAAQLQHPNIVPIHRVGEANGVAFFTMGYVDGETLADRIRHRGRFAVDDAVALVRDIASALGAAHRRGIVHRDVKPHNILIERETGRVLVTDFGIARAAEIAVADGVDPDSVTGAGVVMGTPRYMSPEQASGTRDLGPESDLYALGIIFYEMVSGQYPFRVGTPPNFQVAHLTQPPLPLVAHIGDFPRSVEAVIQRLLAKDPADRYPTAEALREALIPSDAASGASRPSRWGRTLRPLGAAVLVIGIFATLTRSSPPVEDPRRSILIGFFENATGDPTLDWLRVGGVEQLAQSLGRWQDLEVIHVERLLDLARRADLDESRPMGREDALRLARAASMGTATIGTIVRLGNALRLSVRLYDVRTRDLLRTASVEARNDSTLPRAFEQLADQILDLSGARPGELVSVEPPTTSIDAYRAYVEGVAARSRWDMPTARKRFEAALAADPRFALAWYELSQALLVRDLLGGGGEFVAFADSARRYASDRPERERRLIEAYHALLHADFPEARRRYSALVALDSTLVDAWTGLADAAQFDLTLRPDARGVGQLSTSYDLALRAYERALALNGNDHRLYANIANLLGYVFFDDGATIPVFGEPPPGDVRSVFGRIPVALYRVLLLGDSLVLVPRDSVAARYSPAVIAASRATARERARGILEQWLGVAPEEGEAHLMMARLLQSDGDYDGALAALDRAEALGASGSLPPAVLRLIVLLEARRFPAAARLASAMDQGAESRGSAAVPEILLSGLINAWLATGQVEKARLMEQRLFGSFDNRQTGAAERVTAMFAATLGVTIDAALDRVTPGAVQSLERTVDTRIAEAPADERDELTEVAARALIQGYAGLGDTAGVARWRRTLGEERIRGLDALVALRAGDTATARRRYLVARADTGGSVVTRVALAETAAGLGLRQEALAHLARADSLRPLTVQAPDPGWITEVRSWPMRAVLLGAEGRMAEARQWAERYREAWATADSTLVPERDRILRELGDLLRTDRRDRP